MKAAGLAGAALVANAVAVVFTVVFARILGSDGYGSLAALVSTFLILSVPGFALQVAAARETAIGGLGEGGALAATLRRWTHRMVGLILVLCVLGVVLRDVLAQIVGVEQTWAAAATLPTGGLWLLLSVQRGVLQGMRAYVPVGLSIVLEQLGRLVAGAVLVAAGLGVTGAYLGTPLAMLVMCVVLWFVLRRRLGAPHAVGGHDRRLRALVAGAWGPILGLTLIAVLQNIDVIVVKHEIGGDRAGSYAAAAVAAKVVLWTAIGVGLYLLPEAARLNAAGRDPRPVLVRALAIILAVSVPVLAIFALVPGLLLRVAFGPDYEQASDALFVLGAAMSLLALAYLAVQYMLALGRVAFLPVLGVVAVLEPLLLTGVRDLVGFATIVLIVQSLAAAGVLTLSLRRVRQPAAMRL